MPTLCQNSHKHRKIISIFQSSIDRCIPEISIAVNINIFKMATVVIIPPKVTAIPYVGFVTSASHLVKQYWTTSFAIVSFLPGCVRSSESQLTTDNATVGIIPSIITDTTPAEKRMIYFNPSCFVVPWIYQSDL